jgi:hypothetical protein
MNRLTRWLVWALAMIAAGCLVAGCAQGTNIKNAVSSLSPSSTSNVSAPASSRSVPPRPTLSPTRTLASPTAPATVHHTVTAPAVPPPASSSPASASPSSAAASSATSSLLWLWILLGVLLVAVVVVAIVIARRSGRRAAVTGNWQSQAADASAQGSALYDAMSLAESQGEWDTEDAAGRWGDIQHRADDLTQVLYRLRDSAPDEEDRARVADVLASLQAVRSSMEVEHTPGGAGAHQGARTHALLQSFAASLRALRSPDVYGP